MISKIRHRLGIHGQRVFNAGQIIPFFARYKKLGSLAALFLLLATAIDVIFPLVAVQLFEDIIHGRQAIFSSIVLGIILLYLFGTITHFVSQLLMTYVGERAVLDLRTQLYQHMHQLSINFFIRHQTGELLSRLSGDTAKLQTAVGSVFSGLITNTLTVIGVFIVISTINYRFALILPLMLIPLVVTGTLLGMVFNRLSYRIQDHLAAAFSLAEDALHGVRTVRAYNRQLFEADRFGQGLQQAFKGSLRLFYWQSGTGGILNLLGHIVATAILVLAAEAVLKEDLSLAQLITFLYYSVLLWSAFYGWMWVYLSIQSIGGATERIFDILEQEPEVQDLPGAVDLQPGRGHICFENVDFAYVPNQTVLQDFCLEIGPGETVAIVGSSGIGKTTVLNLLCRFYDPPAGQILIDSQDVRHVTQHSLRSNIGIVFQEPFIFSTTIGENIRYGNLTATEPEIIAVAQQANVHEFVSRMPEGYATPVGENGYRLSSGQRQRIALARMLLAKPAIILLDEVTASLDAETEAIITGALKHHFSRQTTLIVTHRLSTAQLADRVAVLHEGKVVELGLTADLMQNGSHFNRLFQLQAEAKQT